MCKEGSTGANGVSTLLGKIIPICGPCYVVGVHPLQSGGKRELLKIEGTESVSAITAATNFLPLIF